MNKEIIEAIKSTKSVDELKKLAEKKGYNLTDENASRYFGMFHNEGHVDDSELESISGGACGVAMGTMFGGGFDNLSRNGSLYSGNSPHRLITTVGNDCNLYESDPDLGIGKNCYGCKHSYFEVPTLYCKARTWENDPVNPRYVK